MNIALILQHKLLLGIQRFMLGEPIPAPVSPTRLRSHASPEAHAPRAAALCGSVASPSLHTTAKVMPLRVLRVLEQGQPRSSTGRMVISGRMADVCAELDRLVEREAALH
jgi:hypothetical protein